MVITYYGVSCFKVQSGETVLAFDPASKEFPAGDFDLKTPRFQADVVLTSHKQHSDHNGTLPGKGDKEEAIVIDGPGEYEIGGVYINGADSFHDENQGEELGRNTIYTLNVEGISICHLGDFSEKNLRPETKSEIGEVDILFIPISGPYNNPQKAAKIAAQLEPKIVIPMHYHKDAKALKVFLDELGSGAQKPVDKLTLKKKDLSDKQTEVIVLNTA